MTDGSFLDMLRTYNAGEATMDKAGCLQVSGD